MRMVDLINKKKLHQSLTSDEISFMIENYCNETIPDYQMSAMLMAICFNGLNSKELADFTSAMIKSGDQIDLTKIDGIKVDKHSTGGVGDKTSLVLGPLVASCGALVAKMSGRGLGHTGGTLDKLESIPGFNIEISLEDFYKQVDQIGIAIVGQMNNLVVADKKLYALRDVTGTVDSIGLIASSIMSKKLASGADTILLDVKYGKGAFMKTVDEAILLAKEMIQIGNSFSKDTKALITNMNQPLGNAIGNSLEVIEAIECLQGNGPDDLLELCLQAGSIMLVQASIAEDENKARKLLIENIENKKAFNKLVEMVKHQGGDISYLLDTSKFKLAPYKIPVLSKTSVYISEMDSLIIGEACMHLGGGRLTKTDKIDHGVGIVLNKKIGDTIEIGEPLFYIYSNREQNKDVINMLNKAITITKTKGKAIQLIEQVI